MRVAEALLHAVQRRLQISPWSFNTRELPAQSCSPSTFCVTRAKLPARRSICARAECPGLGAACAISPRRQSYHSHTNLGSRANASGVARSSARKLPHKPPFPRNVGMPLSAEMPAPVSTAMEAADSTHARAFEGVKFHYMVKSLGDAKSTQAEGLCHGPRPDRRGCGDQPCGV